MPANARISFALDTIQHTRIPHCLHIFFSLWMVCKNESFLLLPQTPGEVALSTIKPDNVQTPSVSTCIYVYMYIYMYMYLDLVNPSA